MLARRLHLSAAPALRRLSTKSSTGIVGMEVRPDAPEILLSLYSKTLAELESLPAEVTDALRTAAPAEVRRILPKRSMLCLLYTSPSPRDRSLSRMPSSA